jgi:Putative zinc-finger
MTCQHVRSQLALFVYGDLSATEAAQVETHLQACAACVHEIETLRRLRGSLDAVPAPPTNVNLARLFQAAWQQEQRRGRRSRRWALAVTPVAATILLVLLAANLRIGWQEGGLTIAWRPAPVPPIDLPQKPTPLREEDIRTADLDRRLETLTDIVHALAANLDSRDQREQADVAELRGRIQLLQQEILRLRAAAMLTPAGSNNTLVRLEKGDTR